MSMALSSDSVQSVESSVTRQTLPLAAKSRRFDPGHSKGSKSDQPANCQLVAARTGDHLPIHQLLLEVLHRPSTIEFQAALDHPEYQPGQRLLVKHGPRQRLIGHVQLCRREVRFGAGTLPTVDLADLAVLPEFQRRDVADSLLAEAELQAAQNGAMVATARTACPIPFLRRGWALCGRHSFSTAGPRRILSGLQVEPRPPTSVFAVQQPKRFCIRSWRHFEQDALTRLYDEHTRRTYGTAVRSDENWRWLIERHAYDRIYVAVEGNQEFTPSDMQSRIAGYAVTGSGSILEMFDTSEDGSGATQLMAHICGDAIERGRHLVRFHAPPDDPRHAWIRQAGGTYSCGESDEGAVFVAKVLHPAKLLRCLAGELHERTKRAGLARGSEMGLCLGNASVTLQLSPRSVRVSRVKFPRSNVTLANDAATQLLLGHLTIDELIDRGSAVASTRVARELALALFPRVPWWRPPLDDLQA